MVRAKKNLSPKHLRLIKAAEQCFSRNGYYHTTIREIALAAHTNSCMITYYFGSKENLLLSIIDFKGTTFREMTPRPAQKLKSPLQHLLNLSEAYMKKVFSEVTFHRLVIQLNAIFHKEKVLSRLHGYKIKNYEFLNEIVQEGIALGVFHKDTEVENLLTVITSTTNYYILNLHYLRLSANFEGNDKKFLSKILPNAVLRLHKLLKAAVN